MKATIFFAVAFAASGYAQSRQGYTLVMDGHVHVMTRQLLDGSDIGQRYSDGHVDLPRARAGGVNAMFFSIYTPENYYAGRYETKNTVRVLELAREQIEKNHDVIELALNASDIEQITRSGKIAAFLDLEGGFDLDGDIHVLRALYRMGLRSLQLTAHNRSNGFVDSCCDVSKWGGINDRGREIIREMNRLGMVINVAHASEETMLQTVDASSAPVVFSHGGFRHFVDIPRCISDRAAKAIAAKGGVIGIQFGSTFNNPTYYAWTQRNRPTRAPRNGDRAEPVRTLADLDAALKRQLPFVYKGVIPDEYWMGTEQLAKVIDYGVRLVGEDHIALGSDFDGGPPLPREMHDISDYPEMTKAMERLGYSQERIRKIMGLNWLRVIRQVTDGK